METIQQNQHRKHPYLEPMVTVYPSSLDCLMEQKSPELHKTEDAVDDDFEALISAIDEQERADRMSLW